MAALRTIFTVIPTAQSVGGAVAAYSALPLAEHSKLIGLYVSPITISYGLGADVALADFITTQMEAAETEGKAAEAAFVKACTAADIPGEWRTEKAPDYMVSPHAGAIARAADLIVCPSVEADASVGRHQIEEIVFASGRPVLAVPGGWSGKTLGETVVVAWDGGREAARALFDAIPLLGKAKTVRLISIQGFLDEPVRQFTLADDIAQTLSRHGIRAETRYLPQQAAQREGGVQGADARNRRRPPGDGLLRPFALPRIDPRRRFPRDAERGSLPDSVVELSAGHAGHGT